MVFEHTVVSLDPRPYRGERAEASVRFDLNLKQLKVFYYVAKHLSFTRAAEELFITQPAVTMQISSLERQYGLRLFSRKKNDLRFSFRSYASGATCPLTSHRTCPTLC